MLFLTTAIYYILKYAINKLQILAKKYINIPALIFLKYVRAMTKIVVLINVSIIQ